MFVAEMAFKALNRGLSFFKIKQNVGTGFPKRYGGFSG
jgi:hypothetical protein